MASLLSRILRRIRDTPRRIRGKLAQRLARSAHSSSKRALLYYAFFNDSFDRECRGVLAGRRAYSSKCTMGPGDGALLRRNVHRLEKGLLMRPRRDLFALEYIAETFNAYKTALSNSAGSNLDLVWAHAVLDSYFGVTASHPKLDPLRSEFQSLSVPTAPDSASINHARPFVPYAREITAGPPVSYDALLALAERRRSVRWFLDKPVPRELTERAVAIAAQAPSACNRQPFEFRVLDDPELARRAAGIPMGTTGYDHQLPAVAVVVGQLRNYFDERDRHLIYIDGSLAAMSFAFALETLGLSSCMINWPDIEEKERAMAHFLGLEPDERPVMLIAFGYPDPEGLVAASAKKPIHRLMRYNFE